MLYYYHSAEDIEEICKDSADQDLVDRVSGAMRREFPNFMRVFLDERDIFLAHSLKRSTQIQLGPEGKILCLVCQIKSTLKVYSMFEHVNVYPTTHYSGGISRDFDCW